MTFEGQYLTYAEYRDLGGSAIGEMPFNLLEFEARRKIDTRTQDRLKKVDSSEIPQEVKLCVYSLINSINDYMESSKSVGTIANETTDGYSIGYITADRISEVIRSKSVELDDIIRTYLLGVVVNNEHIMFLGVN